jgi:hypothetical protein
MLNYGIVVPICDYPEEIFRAAAPVSGAKCSAGVRSGSSENRFEFEFAFEIDLQKVIRGDKNARGSEFRA